MSETTPHASKAMDTQPPIGSPSSSEIPEKALKGSVMDQDFVPMYKHLYHEAKDSENRPTTPSLDDREMQEFELKMRQMQEDKIKVFQYILNNRRDEVDHSETIYLCNMVEVGHFLLPTSQYINQRNADEAWKMVASAMEIARRSEHEVLIAKCEYWMGRVEFLRGNIAAAHKHFMDAHACAMDPFEGVECLDLSFYHDITKPGISDFTRTVRLRAYEEVIAAECAKRISANSDVPIEKKRKRPLPSWKDVLVDLQHPLMKQRPLAKIRKPRRPRPVVSKIDETQPEQGLDRDQDSNKPHLGNILAEELGFESGDDFGDETDTDTADEPNDGTIGTAHSPRSDGTADKVETTSPKAGRDTDRPTLNSSPSARGEQAACKMSEADLARARYRLECLQLGQTSSLNPEPYVRPKEPFVFGIPHEPTKQTEFRLGFFKVGLANRSRPMTLFPKQPGEITISPEEWKSMEHFTSRKIVTYQFLERERYELMRIAEEM